MTKIVLIEDNPVNMKLNVFLLNSAGHQVLQAINAEDGMELIRAELPALVLMDIQLPGMDGLTATRLLKADPELAHIKVIAVTAHAMSGDEAILRAAGFDGYLPKPVHHLDLVTMVKRMLEQD